MGPLSDLVRGEGVIRHQVLHVHHAPHALHVLHVLHVHRLGERRLGSSADIPRR